MEFCVVEWYTAGSRKAREDSHLLSNYCVSGVSLILFHYYLTLSPPRNSSLRWEHWLIHLVSSRGNIWVEIWLTVKSVYSVCVCVCVCVCVLHLTWILGLASDKRCRLFFYRLEWKIGSVMLRALWLNTVSHFLQKGSACLFHYLWIYLISMDTYVLKKTFLLLAVDKVTETMFNEGSDG